MFELDAKFWLRFWLLVAVFIWAMTGTVGYLNQRSNTVILDMVKAGATPTQAYCVVTGINSVNIGMCTSAK